MKLSVKPGRNGKVHIYIDDEYRMSCDGIFWFSEKWHNLKEVNEEELAELEHSVSSRRAFNKGANLINRRPHSRKEIIIKLGKDFPREICEEAADKLEELYLINDERFAEIYADELFRVKKFGPKRIFAELKAKGISSEIAQNAVDLLDKDDINRIILVLNSKYKNKLDDDRGVIRAMNGLVRMGYSYSDIREAMKLVCENSDSEDYYE